jgi:hypothetical protein
MTLPAPPMVFEERTGARRRVVLRGRGLPYRPIEFDTTQRVEVSSPAGLHGGVSTVLGPVYGTSSFKGTWKDKYIGRGNADTAYIVLNGGQVATVIEAERLFTSIVEQGQELNVSWGPVYRRGHIKSFKVQWLNVSDLEWTMELAWLSRSERAAAAYTPNRRPPTDISNSTLERLTAAVRGFRGNFAFAERYQDAMLRTTQRINALTEELDTTLNVIDRANPLRLAESTARSAVVTAGSIATVADARVEALRGSIPFASMADYQILGMPSLGRGAAGSGLPVERIPPERLMEAEVRQRENERLFRDMRNDAAAYERARMTPTEDLLGTYRTREGEDLRDVSLRYYGTPLEWRRLMEFNELTSSEVPTGTLLVIPRGSVEEDQGDGV